MLKRIIPLSDGVARSVSSLFRLHLQQRTRNVASLWLHSCFLPHNSNAEGLEVTEMKVNGFGLYALEKINKCNTLRELLFRRFEAAVSNSAALYA